MKLLKKAGLSSLLIIGVFLLTSIAASALDYKGKCRDKIEKDLDKCRVELENNRLHLKFKESELNETIDLNQVDHLKMTSVSKDNHLLGTSQDFISFSFSWQDGARNYFTSFRLKDEESRELVSFIRGKGKNEIINNEIDAYFKRQAEIGKASSEMFREYLERQHELEMKKIESQQPRNYFPILIPQVPLF